MENQEQLPIQPQIPVQSLRPEQKTEAKKPLPKLKIAALIVLLILVLTVPFGGYLLLGKMGIHPKPSTVTIKTTTPTATPTPDPTTDWKTYTGENFTFKYPSTWIFDKSNQIFKDAKSEFPPINGFSIDFGLPLTDAQRKAAGYLDSATAPKIHSGFSLFYSPDPLSQKIPPESFIEDTIITSTKVITVGGNIQAEEYTYACQGDCWAIVFKQGNMVFKFSLPTDGTNLDQLHQILSTFKFTDQTSQGDESTNWKTYTNPDYGFSFKYPNQFSIDGVKKDPNGISSAPYYRDSYEMTFTTGEMVPNGDTNTIKNFSGFIVQVKPANGLTLKQYLSQQKNPYNVTLSLEYTVLPNDGNAEETAKTNTEIYRIFKYGNYFYTIILFQNGAGKTSINDYISQVLSTLKFSQ
jgi:hypothetical protein